jgi:hypothetical protein
MSLALDAMMLARRVHADHKRKYTNAPYTDHLAEVAGIVATIAPIPLEGNYMVAVAWLKDSVERGVTYDDLRYQFNESVAKGVMALTGLKHMSGAEVCERIAAVPGWVQSIVCATIISAASIVQAHPEDGPLYEGEARFLLDALTNADPRLLAIAREQVGGAQ